MSQITRVHGDFQQVAVADAGSYANVAINTSTSNVSVQPQGPKLDFFTVSLATVQSNATVSAQAIQTIEQLATLHIFEFLTGSPDTLAIAIYPTGAWTTTTLKTAIDTATGGTSTVTLGATFVN